MDSTPIKLLYHITADRPGGHYYIYIQDKHLKHLELPDSVLDEIMSLGITPDEKLFNDTRYNLDEYIIWHVRQMLKNHWDWQYGVPIIRFNGKISTFNEHFHSTNIVPIFIQPNKDILDQFIAWFNVIPLLTQFSLVVFDDSKYTVEHPSSILSNVLVVTSHTAARRWIKDQMALCLKRGDKYQCFS